MRIKIVILAAAWAMATGIECHAKTPLGKAGDWVNTSAAAVLNGTIYTVETGGALYATAPADGTWKQIGKPDFANTAFLLASQNKLISIENNGSLYLIDPKDGSWRQSGKAGDWVNTSAAAVLNGTLYTVETGGALYATAPADGTWKQIGKPDFANTAFLLASQDKLISIEKNGSLSLINPKDGAWRQSGKAGEWKDTLAGAACNGKLFTVASDGTLQATDPGTGARQKVGNAQYSDTTHLLVIGNQLYAITSKGDLSSTPASDMAAAQPATAGTTPTTDPEDINPALAGQLTFKFMGQWKGDTAEFEKDPEFQKHKAANPEIVQGLLAMMQGLKMKVTLDGISMTVMDQTVGPYAFEALSASGNTLCIENKDGPKKGVQARIIFRDDKHIQIIEDNNDGKAMFFKKD